MFDIKKFPATPAMARKVITYSKLNRMRLDQNILDLAATDLVDMEQVSSFDIQPDSAPYRVVQHSVDWQGRATLLDDGSQQTRVISLAVTKVRNTKKNVILVEASAYAAWARLVRLHFPDDRISVFGNSRYLDPQSVFPHGVEFSDEVDAEADWFITSYSSFIKSDLLRKIKIQQIVIEELDNESSVNYRWTEAVSGIFKEIHPILFIINLAKHQTKNDDLILSLQSSTTPMSKFITETVIENMWVGRPSPRALQLIHDSAFSGRLARIGYRGVSFLHLLSTFGVAVDLVNGRDKSGNLHFTDNDIKLAKTTKGKSDFGLHRFLEREDALCRTLQVTIPEIVTKSLDGDQTAEHHLSQLQNTQWANFKAGKVKTYLLPHISRPTRTLIFAENSELIRSLKLQFSTESLPGDDPDRTIARFLYPDPKWKSFLPEVDAVPPLSNLIVGAFDLERIEILENATFMVLAEWPTDRVIYECLKEICKTFSIRLIHMTLAGTFEEELSKQLTG